MNTSSEVNIVAFFCLFFLSFCIYASVRTVKKKKKKKRKNRAFAERHRIYISYASAEADKAISPGASFKYRLSVDLTE